MTSVAEAEFVSIGGFSIWVWADDVYEGTAHNTARHVSDPALYVAPSAAQFAHHDLLLFPVPLVLNHFWLRDEPFTYFDVGAKYGASAIHTTLFMRGRGHDDRVICFEPSSSSQLLAANIAANGLGDDLAFEPIAVSDKVGSAALYGESGYPENNRIVNPTTGPQTFSNQVPTTSLDAYVTARRIDGSVIVKVDTQGAEWEVLAGMQRLRRERLVVMVIEFTPWALESRVSPTRFLDELAGDSYLIDLGMVGSSTSDLQPKVVLRESHAEFPAEVMLRNGRWTDLLVVPRRLQDSQAIVDAVLNSGIGPIT